MKHWCSLTNLSQSSVCMYRQYQVAQDVHSFESLYVRLPCFCIFKIIFICHFILDNFPCSRMFRLCSEDTLHVPVNNLSHMFPFGCTKIIFQTANTAHLSKIICCCVLKGSNNKIILNILFMSPRIIRFGKSAPK